MKINSIFTGILLVLMGSNANAFSSIHIDFPQGLPELVTIESKISTGQCTVPADKVNCHTEIFNPTLPVIADSRHIVEEYLQSFSKENANKLVDNQWDKPNNYMKFSIPGKNNTCYIDLLKNKPDIFVHLNKDGSCYQ